MNARFDKYVQSLTKSRRDIAMEAVREYLKGEKDGVEVIDSPVKVYNVCKDLSLQETEQAEVLLLNNKYKLIKRVELSHGGLTETLVDIRVMMKHALLNNATVIGLVHNHPSGDSSPSRNDDNLTCKVKKACDVMRIYLMDHVIIGDGCYYSYREHGKL